MRAEGIMAMSRALQVIEPTRRLQGRQFEPIAEAELKPTLLGLAITFRSTEILIAIPEFYGIFGVADLAVVAAKRSLLANRQDRAPWRGGDSGSTGR
jgi:hypothetical protein